MDVEKTSSMLMRCDRSTQLNEPWESQSIMWIYGEYAKLSQKYNWKWDSFLGSMFQRQTTSVQQNVVYCVEVEALLMARALAIIVEVAICCMNGMSFGLCGREWLRDTLVQNTFLVVRRLGPFLWSGAADRDGKRQASLTCVAAYGRC